MTRKRKRVEETFDFDADKWGGDEINILTVDDLGAKTKAHLFGHELQRQNNQYNLVRRTKYKSFALNTFLQSR